MRVNFVVAVVALAIGSTLVAASPSSCEGSALWSGCEVSNSGTQVDIGASSTNSNQSGGSTAPGTSPPSGGTVPNPPGGPGAPGTPAPPEDCGPLGCRANYSVIMPPEVTIDDLASFRPAVPNVRGEPLGFGVAGLPTNLVATASAQEIAGTILDWEVTVRFVPAGFVFDTGDGESRRVATGGSTWSSLGLPQFSPTPTSHVYRERGEYSVAVTVQYTAAVDFGSGWRPVAGFVSATATGYGIRVVEANTALVDRTCAENPRGPGC